MPGVIKAIKSAEIETLLPGVAGSCIFFKLHLDVKRKMQLPYYYSLSIAYPSSFNPIES